MMGVPHRSSESSKRNPRKLKGVDCQPIQQKPKRERLISEESQA